MKAGDLFRMAGANLKRRKGRTVLTTVGVVIGVGALVLMISLGIGLERQVLRSFEAEEIRKTILVSRIEGQGDGDLPLGPHRVFGETVPISTEQIGSIEKLERVDHAFPLLDINLPGTIPLTAPVRGRPQITTDHLSMTGVHSKEAEGLKSILLRGRVWNPGERACVIPSAMLESRFGAKIDDLALGQPMTLRFKPKKNEPAPPAETLVFTMVGIADSERLGLRGHEILLPQERALELWDLTSRHEKDQFPRVEVRVKRAEDVDAVKAQLKNMGYETLATTDLIKMIKTSFLVLEGFLGCIGAIGLIVALFGIANTMAMSVLERTREIGIMKALGARNRDIRRLFLLEAAWIGWIGGVVGLSGGWLLGKLLNTIARGVFELLSRTSLFHVSVWLAAGSLAFAVAVSVVAGVIPAVRASRKDPVVALRYE